VLQPASQLTNAEYFGVTRSASECAAMCIQQDDSCMSISYNRRSSECSFSNHTAELVVNQPEDTNLLVYS